jgi:beta-N-acetylhexosaminidase
VSLSACILGCSGPELTAEERAFFRDVRPWGFILFARNIQGPEQVRRLTDGLREAVGWGDAPVLADQEGGRVQRLGPPHWRRYPPGRAYGGLGAQGREIARLGARLIAHDLRAVGVTVDCLPVLDVPDPAAHEVIGDRAYSESADEVAALGRAAAEGLIAGGVLPVIKHIPGHGRARGDSHQAAPVVEATRRHLEARDFAPFRVLSDMPMAMTAHVIYRAIDERRPATTSPLVVSGVIRRWIGFDGLLVSDDLSMRALSGPFQDRAAAAHAAGCDMVLHGAGDLAEMKAVAAGARPLAGKAKRRAEAALTRVPKAPEPFDVAAARRRFEAAFEGRWAA